MKIIFKKTQHFDVLMLDNIKDKIILENVSQYFLNKNEINIFYFFHTICLFIIHLGKFTLRECYLIAMFNAIKPKIILDHSHNGSGFKLKKIFPKVILIIYQLGHFFSNSYDEIKIRYQDKICDYFLVFNYSVPKILKKMKTKFVITGSIRNNKRSKKKTKKKYDVMFISEFRKIDPLTDNTSVFKDNFKRLHFDYNEASTKRFSNICSAYALKAINEYQKTKKNTKISIALSSNRIEKKNKISSSDEKLFYNAFISRYSSEKIDSESLAEKSKIIICLTSNLGLELLSKGHKVLFFNFHSFAYNWSFGANTSQGPFWYKGQEKKIFFKIIKNLLRMSDKRWHGVLKKYQNLMYYDHKNSILNKIIFKELNNKI